MIKKTQVEKEKTGNKAGEFAKQIWLAGLGAYGKAFDEATERYDKATKESPKLFRELVAKGTKLENETREALAESKIVKTGTNLEQRIQKMRESVNLGFLGTDKDDIKRIEAKLDKLSKEVGKLTKAMAVSEKPNPKKTKASS